MTWANLSATSRATSASAGLPTRSIAARGSSDATSIFPAPASCTITLHGSITPILSSADRAWCANGGLLGPELDPELLL